MTPNCDTFIQKKQTNYSSDSRTITPGLLHFAIFCQNFEKIRLKTILKREIPRTVTLF